MDAMVAVVMRFPFAKCLSLLESLQLAVVSDGLHPFPSSLKSISLHEFRFKPNAYRRDATTWPWVVSPQFV